MFAQSQDFKRLDQKIVMVNDGAFERALGKRQSFYFELVRLFSLVNVLKKKKLLLYFWLYLSIPHQLPE